MEPSDALRRGPRVVVDEPSDVLPFYLLAAGAAVAARVPLVVAIVVALASLSSQGRLRPFVDALAEFDPSTATPPPGFESAARGLVTPTVVAALAAGFVLAVALFVVVRAATTAASLAAVYAALRGDAVRTVGVKGVGRHWRAFLGLTVVRALLFTLASAPLLAATVAVGSAAPASLALAGALVLVSVLAAVAVHLALAFAGQAVVVDDVGTRRALRRSVGFPVRRPWAFAAYVVVALAAVGGFGGAAVALTGVGAPQAGTLLSTLLVFPMLDGFKTALYAEHPPAAEPSLAGLHRRGGRGVRTGLRRLASFVRERPAANAASAACLLAGGVAGWLLTEPYGTLLDPADGEMVSFGGAAPAVFVNLAANNWLVAAATGYSGAMLGVPAATSLLLNGALVGGLAGVTESTAFLALVAPHGVLELPAIVVAGGLGFRLAAVTWRGYRGRLSATAVGDAFVEAFEVLVGLAVVFVVAAFVEAFVTPLVAAAVLS